MHIHLGSLQRAEKLPIKNVESLVYLETVEVQRPWHVGNENVKNVDSAADKSV
jgi:hypothetical protein